jgi:nucleotide-binding universal stress UspA family protein
MKLLVPVDGSAASYTAAQKSAEIAKKYGAVVMLLTVVNDDLITSRQRNERLWRQSDGSVMSGKTRTFRNDEYVAEMREDSMELLDSLTEELDFGSAKVEKAVLIGEPYHVILETAKGISADLIVMGNRGFSKIKRFFVGSVTQRVISEAPCPVLVIHTDAKD